MQALRLALFSVFALSACGRSAHDATPSGDSLATRGVTIRVANQPPLGADSGVLFSLDGSPGSDLTLIPIAIVLRGLLIAPPRFDMASANDPFVRRFLAENTMYTVFTNGVAQDSLRLTRAAFTGCDGYTAGVALARPTVGPIDALAGHLTHNPRPSRRRALSPAERAVLDSLVLTILREHQLPGPLPRATNAPHAFAFALDTGGTMVLTGDYDYVLQPIDSGRTVSISLIAESVARGRVVGWSNYAEGSPGEGSGGGTFLLDALDIDGDGTVELVLRRTGFEDLSFRVLRRNASGWSVVYAGGGFGC